MLKGLNRRSFEEKLAANLRRAVSAFGRVSVTITQGRMFLEPADPDFDFEAAVKKAADVFGVVSASPAWRTATDQDSIAACAETAVRAYITKHPPAMPDGGRYPFKVETKRQNKSYPRTSPEISRETGEYLLSRFPELTVDVNHPQVVVFIEVREYAYVYTDRSEGFGGLPLGTNGKALLLLSGGIDSPVAGFMMAKRGVEVEAVHFYSYPYTSERSKEKVLKLAAILAGYFGRLKVHIVPFTDAQLAVRDNCREEFSTIVMRRLMMFIADAIARQSGSLALVTGESMGQVASQTILGLSATDRATDFPIFRPLIGMDKHEIVEYARRIGTFETSILPYEDCCTVFTPKHPKTKPKLAEVEAEEARIPDLAGLVRAAAEGAESVLVRPD
jgi:thiamine biosynthesis protein ThiI